VVPYIEAVRRAPSGGLWFPRQYLSPYPNQPAVFKSTVSDELPAEERHLQRLQRMATLGTLASGLGHDLRNLVMPVLLRLDVVAASNELPEKARNDLASIRQSILRLQRLAGGLRLLSSDPFDQRDESQLTSLHDWWLDLQPIVADALPPHSIVEATIGSDLPKVAIPPGVLAQILINLVMNSRQAMEHTASPHLRLTAHEEAGRVEVEIEDNGSGMDEETRRRCFEPYFTTRARGYATGLGLSTGRALMNRYGGDLVLGDERDVGTAFTISIPVRPQPVAGNNGAHRRVRLLLRDPRQLAMLRLLIKHRGLEELPSHTTETADLTICDVDALPLVIGADSSSSTRAAGSIIAIGTPKGDTTQEAIRWVDPKDFSILDDVLH
jgi:signal transduction histidine kinase